MKNDLKLLITAIAALGLSSTGHAAETLTQAQITKIVKDVKTIDAGKAAREAVIQETLQGDQSVRTGIESRTELLFNDKTITRLGANTHFSFSEGTRNMSLQSGVMLLQVPKNIGGAKIETAAVTAAVTGTTIMIEAGKDYTKLIVLEGECCLWPKSSKNDSKFLKFKHKTCATAGQEIILRNGDKEVPDPVYVNLKLLESTSLLLTGNWGTDINHAPVDAAADDQKPIDYIPTNLAIIGAGTDVTVITSHNPENPPAPPSGPPGKYGPLSTIVTPNPYIINNTTVIVTDPIITTNGLAGYGKIYRGGSVDGPASNYLFGFSDPLLNITFGFHNGVFVQGGVAVFKFANLQIAGVPTINVSNGGPDNLALIAEGNISFATTGTDIIQIDLSSLNSLTLATEGGTINLGQGFTVSGVGSYLSLYTGAGKNITINSDILIGVTPGFAFAEVQNEFPTADLLINAGGVLAIGTTTNNSMTFDNGTWNAVGGMQLGGNITANDGLVLTSLGDINFGSTLGDSSSSLSAFQLTATGKNINVFSNAEVDAFFVNLNATNTININGSIYANTFTADTTAGTGALPESGVDFDSSNESGYINANTITVKSRGFLGLAENFPNEGAVDTINSVEFEHYEFTTLDLTGNQIVVTTDYNARDTENDVTVKLTSHYDGTSGSGDIIIQGAVSVPHFEAIAAGTIYGQSVEGNNSPSIQADTVKLTVGVTGTLVQDSDSGLATLNTVSGGEFPRSLNLILANFNTPTYDLEITTTGDLTVGTAFSDANNSGFAEQGMSYLNLFLTANYDSLNQPGNIIITDAINVYAFNGNATGEIRGEGTITATYIRLSVGTDATLINSVSDLGSGNTLTNTTVSYGDENSIRLILDDETNTTQVLSVTGNNVTVGDTDDNPGFNNPNLDLTLNANFGTVTVNGPVFVASFESYASQGYAGTGKVTAQSYDLHTNVDASLSNTVTMVNTSKITTTTFGPSGGTIQIVLDDSDNATTSLTAESDGALTVATDFSGPYLTSLTLNGFGTTNINGIVSVNGADAQNVEDSGGNGGTVNAFSFGDINVNKAVNATTGLNGSSVQQDKGGGTGGTVHFEAYGTINVNDKIEVSSNSGLRESSAGGSINLTSHKTTGTAINVANTGQLNSLLNAATAGPGGTITFLADGGGNIAVSGTVRADRGTIDIQATGTSANVALSGATLSGDTVKVAALGNNGTLTIGGGSINGDTAIKLYAAGSNGTVNFIANTSLTGASVKSIAGNTVNVFNGVSVNVSGGAATVYTNNANYTGSGGNGTRTGQFTGNGATTQPLANRPGF